MTPNAFPKSRFAIVLAIAVLLGVLGDAFWVRADPKGPPWQGLDDWWNGLVGGPDDGLMWNLATFLDYTGAEAGLVVCALGVVALILVRRWRSAVYACAVLAATALLTDVLKSVGERPRPADIMVDTGSWAFPSGHSSRIAAIVVVIGVLVIPARRLKLWWPIAVLITFAMMLARNWQHAHWLTDTVAGAAIGWAVAFVLWWALTPLLDRERALRESVAVPSASTAGAPGTGAERLS